MSWLPFILVSIGLSAVIFGMVYGLGTEGYRNWVKSQHQKPWLMFFLLIVSLAVPFAAIFFQH